MEIKHLADFFQLHQDAPRDVHILTNDPDAWQLIDRLLVEGVGMEIHLYSRSVATIQGVRKVMEWEKNISADNHVIFEAEENFEACAHPGVLMFDMTVDVSRILQYAQKKPVALVGMMNGTNVSYLPVWEAYRECSQYVYLQYLLNNGKKEVFDWTKGQQETELSVIFPVYNVAKYLDQCIQSISAWKAPYVEYLFVNDGSPDNSREMILQYARKDPRIKLIDKENGGCASARQKGLEQARGRYIGFIDPDDFIDPDMFRQLLGRALLGQYEVCYCGYNEYYENSGVSRPMPDALGDPYAWGTQDKRFIQKLTMYQRVAIWRGIYRRDLLDRAGIAFQTQLRRFDDLPFKVEVCAQARSVVALKQHLYYYRLDRPGQDVSCTDERLYVHFDIFRHLDQVANRLDERKFRDYLQVCKVQTHAYAMQKIQEKYVDAYARQAKKDFSGGPGVARTLLCLRKWIGGAGTGAYLSVMFGRARAYKRKMTK